MTDTPAPLRMHHLCTCGGIVVEPQLVSDTDNWTRMLVKEMVAHKHEYERARDAGKGTHELDSFWLRKSKQPVLSVLMVKKKGKGMNVEVSMPTGSLCSERNAIGSALSSDPTLKRNDLRMIAVLAVGLEPFSTTSTLSADLPVPPKLIPLLPTTPHSLVRSPAKQQHDANGNFTFPPLDDEAMAAAAAEEEEQHRTGRSLLQLPAATGVEEGKEVQSSNSAATPRKRKAGVSGDEPPSVRFAVSPQQGPLSPAAHSPRVKRSASVVKQDLAARLGASTQLPPSARPLSPAIRPPSTNTTAAASTPVLPLAHSNEDLSHIAGSPHKQEYSPVEATPTPRSKLTRRMSTAADNGVVDSIYADGQVSEEQKDDYIAHELSLVSKRDAIMQEHADLQARMSGNLAPNAVPPLTSSSSSSSLVTSPAPLELRSRTLSAGALQQAYATSIGAPAASLAHPHPLAAAVADERNPINPCGACNEWLKKIAESNAHFRVVTFTSTDCSTCYVKPVLA